MKIDNHSQYLQNLFENNNQLFIDSKTTYEDFFSKSLDRSENYKNLKETIISLCVENTEESLIEIVSIWLSNKSVILHPPGTSEETIKEYENEVYSASLNITESIACYILTSGSTSKAKAIPLTFSNLFSASKNYNNHFAITSKSYLPITLPIYHVGGLLIFLRSITGRCKTSIHSPGKLSKSEFKMNPTHLSVVPLQLERILKSKDDLDYFKTTVFVIGGAKTSINTLKKICDNQLKASSTYGMTETSAMVLATEVSSDFDILQSVGRPLGDALVTLSADHTIIISSSTVSPLYKDSTVQTKDKAFIECGRYFIDGRIDDIFISAGENINPLEIENTLRKSKIEDPFVIPVEDRDFGQKSFLFFRGNITSDAVRNIAKEKLTPFKRPRHYWKIPDCAFTGIKINKSILKELAPIYSRIDQAREIYPIEVSGDPRRPWIIFLHGFMGDKKDWKEVTNILSKDFFCLSIDCPGHGENTKVNYSSLLEFQNEFKEFIAILNHKFHLIGYSQGGRIALGLVLQGLEVESLILESASLGIVDDKERENRLASDLNMFKNISSKSDLKKFLTYWYENPLFGNFNKNIKFSHLLERKSDSNWKLWQEALKTFSVGAQEDYRTKLSRTKISNTLTICGENDHKYLAASMEIKTRFHFKFEKISNSSHNTHFENPISFCKTITNFLK